MSDITLVAIMQNEEFYIDRWVANLTLSAGIFAEVVVVDGGSKDNTVRELQKYGVTVVTRPFAEDFADQRNFAQSMAKTRWTVALDADEILSRPLLRDLPRLCHDADERGDATVGIPRLNFLFGTLQTTPSHLDAQFRINRAGTRWWGRVHERPAVTGLTPVLSVLDGHFIAHYKDFDNLAERNALYRRLGG